MALHEGNIVDFPNKENRTMIHLFPAYLNTLTGRSVLVITHNDYMARKKGSVAELIFNVLGITSGVIQHYSSENQRKHAYNCNVTYLSHEELGLDFLRDNLAMNMDHIVQLHPFYYAIVTNADKVLIDDTKSPLSINRHSTGPMKKYTTSAKIAANLIRDRHYEVEKSKHYVKILPGGHIYAEKVLKKTLFDLADPWIMYVLNALRAKELYEKDEHYQVQDGKVKMLNTFTKKIEDKRFPDGIQQAIEAKEQVNITHEAVSLGRVSYQRIFRLFPRISGLTESTIEDDIEEYKDIYQMDTFDLVKPKIQPLPTSITPEELPQYERIQSNKLPDSLYLKKLTKEKMLLDYIVTSHQQKRPVMIGTDSYEYSLELQTLLSQRNLSSLVVSGKAESAERDYEILVQAARLNAITIITKQAAKGILIQPGGCLKSTLITIFKYMILMQMKSHVESIPELVPYRTILSELVQHTNGSFNSIAHYLHLSFTPLPLELENKLVEAIQTLDLHDIVSPYKLQRLISRISLYHSPIPSNIDALQNMYQECTQLYANEFETYRHEVLRLGGPILLATCRFTNRRWDKLWNIIGQPESPIITSKTFLSFQDELLQRYGAKKIQEFIHTYLIKEKEDIMMIFPDETNELINTVQRVAEDVAKVHRKRLHSLDEITSIQRSAIYSQRRAIVTSTKEGISDIFVKYTMQTLDELYRTHLLPQPTFNQTKAILAPTSANSISLGHTHSSSHHTHNHHNHSLPLRHHPSFTTEYNNSYHLVNITSLFVQLNQFFPGLLITYDDLQYVPHSLLLPLLKDRMIKSFEPLMHSIESATNNSFVHLVRQTILSKIDEKWSKQLMRLHLLEEEIMLLDLITERYVKLIIYLFILFLN